jgi:hypothetical protein
MALPVAKLGTLALRTLSKPIASRLKSQAAVHPKFRNFIIAIAQVSSSSFRSIIYLYQQPRVGLLKSNRDQGRPTSISVRRILQLNKVGGI